MEDTSPRNEFMLSNTKGKSVTMLFGAETNSKLPFFTVRNAVRHFISPNTCFGSSIVFSVTANSINKLLPVIVKKKGAKLPPDAAHKET